MHAATTKEVQTKRSTSAGSPTQRVLFPSCYGYLVSSYNSLISFGLPDKGIRMGTI